MKQYGFYSQQAVDFGLDTCYWQRTDGTAAEVVGVFSDAEAKSFRWPDKVCVGEVTAYCGPGRRGPGVGVYMYERKHARR